MANIKDILNKQNNKNIEGLKPINNKQISKSKKTEIIQTAVSPEIKQALTKKRGHQPESAYVRDLIEKDLGIK